MAELPMLTKGSTGKAVEGLQNALNVRAGAYLAVDGRFGDLTDQAVRSYQAGSGLVVDGVVGPMTWGALHVYAVRRGDSLSKIAQHQLGDAKRWSEIYDLNRALIRDPDKIFPDQVFALPLVY